jgi:glycine/D-amino acid oxidase-like deaminating enzyme
MADAEHSLKVAIAGGSIGGLCAGLALHGSGFDVQVFERHPGPMETHGAGIVVQPELLQILRSNSTPILPTTSCRVRRYLGPEAGPGLAQAMPQELTSWEAIYWTLRAAFPDERYHMGAELDWPRGVAKPDLTFNVASPGPVFIRTERYLNGQASVSSAALKLGGEDRAEGAATRPLPSPSFLQFARRGRGHG